MRLPTRRTLGLLCLVALASAAVVVLYSDSALAYSCYSDDPAVCERGLRRWECDNGNLSACDPPASAIRRAALLRLWLTTMIAALPSLGAALLLGIPSPRWIWRLPALQHIGRVALAALGGVGVALAVSLPFGAAPAEVLSRTLALYPLLLCSASQWFGQPSAQPPRPRWWLWGGLVVLCHLFFVVRWSPVPKDYVQYASGSAFIWGCLSGLLLGMIAASALHVLVYRLVRARHARAYMDNAQKTL